MKYASLLILLLVGAAPQAADTPAAEPMASTATGRSKQTSPAAASPRDSGDSGAKTLSGMCILGNQEAPKSLVIVAWKSSRIGDEPGLSDSLDDSRGPVDKEVFMRELAYYEIRSQ